MPRESPKVGDHVFGSVPGRLFGADSEGRLANVDPGAVPGSGAGRSYEFFQNSPEATWTIVHNLGSYPSIIVIDTLNRQVTGYDITHINLNIVQLDFSPPFSGLAKLMA